MAYLLVRPANFAFNPETAASNALQAQTAGGGDARTAAIAEFDGLVNALRAAQVRCCVYREPGSPQLPDAVFPNNWVSFHRDGTIVLYPLLAPLRRRERRAEVLAAVRDELGFRETRRLDLSPHEAQGRFLEGTGSLVLDRAARVAFACRSPRTDESLLREWAAARQYELVVFDAVDDHGAPYYHTNVLTWIGSRIAAACLEAMPGGDRKRVAAALQRNGRELLKLRRTDVRAFAGNMLELEAGDGASPRRLLLMSARAASHLPAAAMQRLRAAVDDCIVAAVPTIETIGGGSVRCMLAEVPLPGGPA